MFDNYEHNDFRDLLGFITENHLSFCIWKQPFDNNISLIAGNCIPRNIDSLQENEFVFSDFENKDHFIIEPCFLILNGKLLINFFDKEIETILHENNKINYYFTTNTSDEYLKLTKEFYLDLVIKAIKVLDPEYFSKVVLARKKIITLNNNFEPFDFFIMLTKKYPETFVYLLSTEKTGTWIGATPELLLESSSGNIKTTAIAGTRTTKQIRENIQFTLKEKIEQEIVAEHIRKCFKVQNIIFSETSPSIIDTGHLYHIKTDFSCASDKLNIFRLISDLHPTPAVSGYPKDKAIKYILEFENLPRKLYSGILGHYINKDDFHLYVNLRCMEIQRNTGILYAGAGILKDSDPESEWMETENKMQTLLTLI